MANTVKYPDAIRKYYDGMQSSSTHPAYSGGAVSHVGDAFAKEFERFMARLNYKDYSSEVACMAAIKTWMQQRAKDFGITAETSTHDSNCQSALSGLSWV